MSSIFEDPLFYPGPNVHADDPDTSWDASVNVNAPNGRSQRAKVLRCFYGHPSGLIVDEVEDLTGLEEYQARRRTSELFKKDFLERTIDRRTGRKGARQAVMRITPLGRVAKLKMDEIGEQIMDEMGE